VGRVPLVVMAHGFSATREQRLDAYAERFCGAGIAALVFDYRHFGASGGEPRQLLDVGKQHDDYRAALAYVRGLDFVDPQRVALFGSSYSGGHVLAVAARDPSIAAVISQCPYTDSLASLPKLGLANILKATAAGLRDELAALRGRPPVLIPAVADAGRFGVMSTPDAKTGFARITPPDSNWRNEVAARVALTTTFYRPGRAVKKIAAPVLFCVCEGDTVAPAATTLKYASTARHGEIKRYLIGHFEIYLGEAFERAVSDQLDFLCRHLGLVPAAASPEPRPAAAFSGP
jgi:pimeloyl-ACP methyl ester carboxylesterase